MDLTWTGTVLIAAPREQVYAYLADFPRHAEWAQSVVQLALVRPGDERGVGAVYRTAERQGWQADRRPYQPLARGVPGDTMCEVTALVPGRQLAWRSWAPVPGVRHEGHFAVELETVATGTRLTQRIQLRDNWLGDKVSRFVFRTTPAKAYAQWEASLRNIKAILEGSLEDAGQGSAMGTGGLHVV